MPVWMITFLVVVAVIAALFALFVTAALVAVHIVLGRHEITEQAQKRVLERYGADMTWFDGLASQTEKLYLTAYDGVKLSAVLIKRECGTGRVAICCHGYGVSYKSVQTQARLFYERGFDVLLPAMRGHVGSEGKIGMAWIDRFDVLRWADRIVSLYGKAVQIALCGVSMGGSTAIAAAGTGAPSQIKCVIDDCGFDCVYSEFAERVKNVKLPVALSLFPLSVGMRLVHGYSPAEADIKPLAAAIKIPALFIHGDADNFVPIELGKRLFDACASTDKSFVTVTGAGHACCYAADPELYVAEFGGFIDRIFPQDGVA